MTNNHKSRERTTGRKRGANNPKVLRRAKSTVLDTILGRQFKVLNDGFVRVVDYLGNDAAIVQAARISYGKGTSRTRDDRGLIRYLMRHHHTSPFEMCEIKLHVRVPMDTWRQWIRHRTASVNEYSTRYSLAIDAAQCTPPDQWRQQTAGNRQGSEGMLPSSIGADLSADEQNLQIMARKAYTARIEAGVAREQARKDLPLSTYTEAYWKIDLHNLLHFIELRIDPRAQEEIRAYATVIGNKIIARWVPFAWEAFQDYRHAAMNLSRIDLDIINALVSKDPGRARRLAIQYGLLQEKPKTKRARNRERTELESKLRALRLRIPWD